MLLELKNIAHFYGTRCIVKGINLQVQAGSITLLAGPNGAGKSTLLRIMAGLMRPVKGTVTRGAGEDKIGYLGHQTFIYGELSAAENLAFWAHLHGLDNVQERIAKTLARVELTRFAEEKAGTFSRGMAQRLNLARIFLLQPELILLDEPGTGLDARSAAMLRREICDARARGAGLVWVSHSMADDLPVADYVLAIGKGRTAYYGAADGYADFLRQEKAQESAALSVAVQGIEKSSDRAQPLANASASAKENAPC